MKAAVDEDHRGKLTDIFAQNVSEFRLKNKKQYRRTSYQFWGNEYVIQTPIVSSLQAVYFWMVTVLAHSTRWKKVFETGPNEKTDYHFQ